MNWLSRMVGPTEEELKETVALLLAVPPSRDKIWELVVSLRQVRKETEREEEPNIGTPEQMKAFFSDLSPALLKMVQEWRDGTHGRLRKRAIDALLWTLKDLIATFADRAEQTDRAKLVLVDPELSE